LTNNQNAFKTIEHSLISSNKKSDTAAGTLKLDMVHRNLREEIKEANEALRIVPFKRE
jgi:hypothetical protein